MFAVAMSMFTLLRLVGNNFGVVDKPIMNCGMPPPDILGDYEPDESGSGGCLTVSRNTRANEGAQQIVGAEGCESASAPRATWGRWFAFLDPVNAALAFLFTRPAASTEHGFVRAIVANGSMLAVFYVAAKIFGFLIARATIATADLFLFCGAVLCLGLALSGAWSAIAFPALASSAHFICGNVADLVVSTVALVTSESACLFATPIAILSAFDAACREGIRAPLPAYSAICACTVVSWLTGSPATCLLVLVCACEWHQPDSRYVVVRTTHALLSFVAIMLSGDFVAAWSSLAPMACLEYVWSSDGFYNLHSRMPLGWTGELLRVTAMCVVCLLKPTVLACMPATLSLVAGARWLMLTLPVRQVGDVAVYTGDQVTGRRVYRIPRSFVGSIRAISWLMQEGIVVNPQGTQLAMAWAYVAACRYLQGRQVRWWVALHPSAPVVSQLLSTVCNLVARVGINLVVVLREWSPWLVVHGALSPTAFPRSAQLDPCLHATFQWLPGWGTLISFIAAAQEVGGVPMNSGSFVYSWLKPGRSLIALASTLWWMGYPRCCATAVVLACIRSHMSRHVVGVPFIARVRAQRDEAHLHLLAGAAACLCAHLFNDIIASVFLAYIIAQIVAWLNTGELFYIDVARETLEVVAEEHLSETRSWRQPRAVVASYGSTGDVYPLHAFAMTLRTLHFHTLFVNSWDMDECRSMLASVEASETVGPAAQVETYNLLTRRVIASADIAIVPWAFQIEAPRIVRVAMDPPAEVCAYTTTGVKVLDWVYRALLNTSQAAYRLSGTPTSLPRSCDGLNYIRRLRNHGARGCLVTGGSSTHEVPKVRPSDWQTMDSAKPNFEHRTNHSAVFREYECVSCHGGFGTVVTALACGAQVESFGKLLDRRYIAGSISKLRVPWAEARLVVPMFLAAPSVAPALASRILWYRPDLWNYVTVALLFDGEPLRVVALAVVNIATVCWRILARLVQAPTTFGVVCIALSGVFMVVPGVAQVATLSAILRALVEYSFWTARVPYWVVSDQSWMIALGEALRFSIWHFNPSSVITWLWLSIGILMPHVWHENCVCIHIEPLKRIPAWFHAGVVADGWTYEGDYDGIGKKLVLRRRKGTMKGLRLPLPIPRAVMQHVWFSMSRQEAYSPWSNCISVAFNMATVMPLGAGLVTFLVITLVFLHTIWGLGVLMIGAMLTSDFEGTLLPRELILRLRQMAHSAAVGDAPVVRLHDSTEHHHPFSEEYLRESGCDVSGGWVGFLATKMNVRSTMADRAMVTQLYNMHMCLNCERRCDSRVANTCFICMGRPEPINPAMAKQMVTTWHSILTWAPPIIHMDDVGVTLGVLAELYHSPTELWVRLDDRSYHMINSAQYPSSSPALKYFAEFAGTDLVNWQLIVGNLDALHWSPDVVDTGLPPAGKEATPITEQVVGEGQPAILREERRVQNDVEMPMFWTRALDRMFLAWTTLSRFFTGSPVVVAARSAVGRLCQYGAVFCEDLVEGTGAPICVDGPSFKAISRNPKVAWAWVPPQPFHEKTVRRRALTAPLVAPDIARAALQPGADSALLQDIEALNKHCPDGQLPLRLLSFRRHFSQNIYVDDFLTRRGEAMQQLFRAEPHVNAATYATADVLNQVNSRYARAGFAATMTEDEAAEISQALREELPHFFSSVELVDPEYVMAKWVRKFSAGLPFEGQKAYRPDGTEFKLRYRRDLHSTGWAEALANRVREELHKTGETLCGIHHGFPKAYPLPKAIMDMDPTRLRGITAQCTHQYVRDMVFSYQLNKRAPSYWAVAPWMAGLPINGAGLNHVVANLAERKHIFCLDYSAFDSWINKKIVDIIVDLRASGFLERDDAKAAREWIEANYTALQHGYIVNLIDGSATEKDCGLSTGQASVTLDGSLACIIVAMGAFVRSGAGTAREFFSKVSMRNMGDDHAIATDLPPFLFSAAVLSSYAQSVHGIPAKIEGQSINGPVGLVLLQRECVEAAPFAEEFRSIGMETPPWTFRMRKERVVNVQDVTLRPVTLKYLYDRAIGHLLNCAHHRDVYEALIPFAEELRTKLQASGERLYAKRRPIPSYERVLRIWYKPVHEPQPFKRRVDPWSLYLDSQFAAFVVVGRVGRFLRTIGMHALEGDGERVATNEVYGTAAMDVEAFAYSVRNPLTMNAFVDDVRTSPFSVCAAPRHFWRTERTTVGAHDADYFTRRMVMLQIAFVSVTYTYNRLAVLPVLAVFARVYSLIFFEYGSYYGTLSSLHWLGTGGPSRALSMLFPKDPFILHKRISSTLLDISPPHLALLMPPSPFWVTIASYVHLFARAVGGGTSILPVGAWAHGIINHDEWDAFLNQPHVLEHVKNRHRFSISSPTGTAKTMGGAAALARMFRRVIVLVPRKALAKALTNFTWVKRGVPLESHGRIVMTYGYFYSRFVGARNLSALDPHSDLILCDEFHEGSCMIRATLAAIPSNIHLGLMSATPRLSLVQLAQVPLAARFSTGFQAPWEVRALNMHGVKPEDAVVTILEGPSDRPQRMMVIVPSLGEARQLAVRLEQQGHCFEVIDANTSPSEEKWNQGNVIATQVADAGITLPGVDCVVDSGRRLAMHRGVLTELYSDPALSIQRKGRTGRTCNGLYVALMPPSGVEVEEYPTVDMYFADIGFWEGQFELHTGVDNLLGAEHYLEPTLALNDEFVTACGSFEYAEALARIVLRCGSCAEHDEILVSLQRGYLPEIVEDVLSTCVADLSVSEVMVWPASRLRAIKPFLINHGGRPVTVEWLALREGTLVMDGSSAPKRSAVAARQTTFAVTGAPVEGRDVPRGLFRVHCGVRVERTTHWRERRILSVLHAIAREAGFDEDRDIDAIQAMFKRVNGWSETNYGNMEYFRTCNWLTFLGHACQSLYIHFIYIGPVETEAASRNTPLGAEDFMAGWAAFRANRQTALAAWGIRPRVGTLVAPFWFLVDDNGLPQRCILGLRRLVRFEGTPAERVPRLRSSVVDESFRGHLVPREATMFMIGSSSGDPGSEPLDVVYPWVDNSNAWEVDLHRDATLGCVRTGYILPFEYYAVRFGNAQPGRCGHLTVRFFADRLGRACISLAEDISRYANPLHAYEDHRALASVKEMLPLSRLRWCEGLAELLQVRVMVHHARHGAQGEVRVFGRLLTPSSDGGDAVVHVYYDGYHVTPILIGEPRETPTEFVRVGCASTMRPPQVTYSRHVREASVTLDDFNTCGNITPFDESDGSFLEIVRRVLDEQEGDPVLGIACQSVRCVDPAVHRPRDVERCPFCSVSTWTAETLQRHVVLYVRSVHNGDAIFFTPFGRKCWNPQPPIVLVRDMCERWSRMRWVSSVEPLPVCFHAVRDGLSMVGDGGYHRLRCAKPIGVSQAYAPMMMTAVAMTIRAVCRRKPASWQERWADATLQVLQDQAHIVEERPALDLWCDRDVEELIADVSVGRMMVADETRILRRRLAAAAVPKGSLKDAFFQMTTPLLIGDEWVVDELDVPSRVSDEPANLQHVVLMSSETRFFHSGGLGTVVESQARALVSEGFSVYILQDGGDGRSILYDDGIWRMSAYKGSPWMTTESHRRAYVNLILKSIESFDWRNNNTIFHVHGDNKCGMIAMLKRMGFGVVNTVHSTEYLHEFRGAVKRAVEPFVTSAINANVTLWVSSSLLASSVGSVPISIRNSVVLPNAYDEWLGAPDNEWWRCERESNGVPERYVVYAGRYSDQKGIRFLFEALASLGDRAPFLVCVGAGDLPCEAGPMYKAVRHYDVGKLLQRGAKFRAVLCNAVVGAFPSTEEPQGMMGVEAALAPVRAIMLDTFINGMAGICRELDWSINVEPTVPALAAAIHSHFIAELEPLEQRVLPPTLTTDWHCSALIRIYNDVLEGKRPSMDVRKSPAMRLTYQDVIEHYSRGVVSTQLKEDYLSLVCHDHTPIEREVLLNALPEEEQQGANTCSYNSWGIVNHPLSRVAFRDLRLGEVDGGTPLAFALRIVARYCFALTNPARGHLLDQKVVIEGKSSAKIVSVGTAERQRKFVLSYRFPHCAGTAEICAWLSTVDPVDAPVIRVEGHNDTLYCTKYVENGFLERMFPRCFAVLGQFHHYEGGAPYLLALFRSAWRGRDATYGWYWHVEGVPASIHYDARARELVEQTKPVSAVLCRRVMLHGDFSHWNMLDDGRLKFIDIAQVGFGPAHVDLCSPNAYHHACPATECLREYAEAANVDPAVFGDYEVRRQMVLAVFGRHPHWQNSMGNSNLKRNDAIAMLLPILRVQHYDDDHVFNCLMCYALDIIDTLAAVQPTRQAALDAVLRHTRR